MATRIGSLSVAVALMLLSLPAFASTSRVMKAWQDVRALHTATHQVSQDLDRLPTAAEWPSILVDSPGDAGWRGPYIGGIKRDPWGNPYLLGREVAGPARFGIYSMGANGVDERGAGDDVSSWAKFDAVVYYPRGPWDWLFWTIPIALLALLVFVARLALRGLKVLANRRN
jgi:hypothetical protein